MGTAQSYYVFVFTLKVEDVTAQTPEKKSTLYETDI